MSETPLSARELVDSVLTGVVRTGYDGPDGISKDEALERSCILAARVEAVLALLKKYRTIPADLIERILDGGKP